MPLHEKNFWLMFALILDPCSNRMRSVPPLASRVGTEVKLEINGAVAIVTGGGRRIGRAVALGLGKAGARVAVHYHTSEAQANDVAELIKSSGSDAITLKTDLTSIWQTSLLVETAASHLGPVQILINNASVFEKTSVVDTSVEDWERHFAVHVRAPFLLAQSMSSALPPGTQGKIVNMNDLMQNRPERFAYGASKAALSGLTQSLAIALAPNIQVNELALGAILAPSDSLQMETRGSMDGQTQVSRSVGDVVATVTALIRSDYITGVRLNVDGVL